MNEVDAVASHFRVSHYEAKIVRDTPARLIASA